jgi:hypothetical protein
MTLSEQSTGPTNPLDDPFLWPSDRETLWRGVRGSPPTRTHTVAAKGTANPPNRRISSAWWSGRRLGSWCDLCGWRAAVARLGWASVLLSRGGLPGAAVCVRVVRRDLLDGATDSRGRFGAWCVVVDDD